MSKKINEFLQGYIGYEDTSSGEESDTSIPIIRDDDINDDDTNVDTNDDTNVDTNDDIKDYGQQKDSQIQSMQNELVLTSNNKNDEDGDDGGGGGDDDDKEVDESFEKIEMGRNDSSIDPKINKDLVRISLDTKYDYYLLLKILKNKNLLESCRLCISVLSLEYDGIKSMIVHYQMLKGDIEENDVKMKFYNLFLTWERRVIKVSPEKFDFLKKTPSGEIYLKKYSSEGLHLKDGFHHGVVCVCDNKLVGASTFEGGVEMMKQRMENEILSKVRELEKDEILLLEMQDWKDFKHSKEEDLLITDDGKITVVGIGNKVTEFYEKMNSFLKENAKVIEKVADKEILMKYLQYHCKGDIQKILHSVQITFNDRDVELSGLKGQVRSVKEFVEKLIAKLEIESFEEYRPGLGRSLFNQSDSHQLRTLGRIEVIHKCFIVVTERNKPVEKRVRYAKTPKALDKSLMNKLIGGTYEKVANLFKREVKTDQQESKSEKLPLTTQTSLSPIEVKLGCITSSKDSSVLVNTLVSKKSQHLSQCGAISQSFLSAGGEELQTEFQTFPIPQKFGSEMMITSAWGNIKSKQIFHIYASKYRNSYSLKLLKGAIAMCVKEAIKNGHNSIAFPSIGCGKLNYKIQDVCRCFLDIAKENENSIKITIFARDKQTFDQFSNSFSPKPSTIVPRSSPKPKPVGAQQGETTTSSLPNNNNTDDQEKIVTFTVCYHKDESYDTIKKAIHDRLDNIYSEQEIEDMVVVAINECRTLYEKVANICHKNEISLEWDDTRNTIYLRGSSNKVKESMKKIKEIFKAEKKNLENPFYVKTVRGVKAFLEQILKSEKVVFPKHWQNYKEFTTGMDYNVSKTKLEPSGNLFKDICNLVYKTWDATKAGGQGKDAKNLSHFNIEVKNIFVIENPLQYSQYRSNQKTLAYKALDSENHQIDKISKKNEKEVGTKEISKSLDEFLIPEINEYYLFHGTKADNVDVIINQGIDSRLSSDNAMFGTGAYFAESSTKADQYADDKTNRLNVGSSLFMFLARVSLGDSFIVKTPQKLVRPPCSDVSCSNNACNCKNSSHKMADSVVGLYRNDGSRLLFREFVIYKTEQSYPEFLIEYVRK